MNYSKLKHDLEILELNQKHELDLLKMQQEQTKKELLSKCTHTYEDGSSAKTFGGTQWDHFYVCDICKKTLY